MPLQTGIILWGLAALVSLPTAIDPLYSFGELKSDYLYSVLLYSVCFTLTASAWAFKLFRFALTISMIILSSMAIISFDRNQWWVITYFNTLGEYSTSMITFLPLVATALFPARTAGPIAAGTRERILALFACILAAAGISFTLSRAALFHVALISVCLFGFAAFKRLVPRWTLLIVAITAFGCAWILAKEAAEQRNTQLTNPHGRKEIYLHAWNEFRNHPLTGVGYGREANRMAYRNSTEPGSAKHNIRHAHNVVLSWAEQMGIAGIAAILTLFGGLVLAFIRTKRLAHACVEADLLAFTGLVFIMVIFIKNMTDMFFANETIIIFFGVCGIFLGYTSRLTQDPIKHR